MESYHQEIIDVHVHVFPERIFEAVWEFFESLNWGVHREHVNQIEKTLARHGVGQAVGLTYAHKVGVAEALNLFAETLGRSSQIYLPFGSIYPDDANFREYTEYALDSPYIFGFKIQPLVQRFDINDPRLDWFYQGCLERDCPLLIHIGTGPMINEFVGPEHFKKLMRRYPELKVCVPHMGMKEYDLFMAMLDDHPNMFLDTAAINVPTEVWDSTFYGNRDLMLRHLDRICFGSDWPMVGYEYQAALAGLDRFEFPAEARPKILRENALRFLGLDSH